MSSPFKTTFIGVAIVFALLIAKKGLSRKKLPPGPRGLPLIGNALDLAKEKPWVTFTEWAKQYGNLTYVSLFGQPWLIINSFSTAVDLLEKRGSIYSNRPILQMVELTGLGKRTALLQNNDIFRTHRRFFSKVMGSTAVVRRWDHIEEEESQKLARRLLSQPEEFRPHIEHFAAAAIMRITYGYEVKEKDDYFVDLLYTGMKGFSELTTPGRFLVELIPPLKHIPDWFPGTEWKNFARRQAGLVHRTIHEPFNWTKSQMEINGVDSFVSDSLEGLGEEGEDVLKWCASAMYGGGGDTMLQLCTYSSSPWPNTLKSRRQPKPSSTKLLGAIDYLA
ncbi:hypothetical protein AX16_009439 [Volvariella volvacea WC 439]|nr:hypothetical protein AX16_009439 [Volvariella volvacea WC 439]